MEQHSSARRVLGLLALMLTLPLLVLGLTLALAISASLNAPIEPTRFGVFRM